MADSVGTILGQVVQDINTLKDEVTGTGDIVGLVDRITGDITIETRTIKLHQKTLNGTTLFWDSDTQGDWDDFDWSGDIYEDGYSLIIVDQCINKDNTFEDIFDTNTFIDTSTGVYTSPIGLNYGYYTIDDGEELVSKIVAKDTKIYTNINLSVGGTNIDDSTLYVSLDNGTTWTEVTNSTTQTITNSSTDGILYKITSEDGVTITVSTVQLKYT